MGVLRLTDDVDYNSEALVPPRWNIWLLPRGVRMMHTHNLLQ